MGRLGSLVAPAVLALLLCPACGSRPRSPRLVLLYATCSLNRRYLSPYNDGVFFTPNIGRFAREAAVFHAHQTEGGLSGTDFAALFSGVQADRHGVFSHPRRLDDGLYLIFEAFREKGFDTFYWAGHPMASAKWNYAQGVPSSNVVPRALTPGNRFRSVLERLRREPNYRALVVTAFTVTHSPYLLDNAREMRKLYPRETAQVDDADLLRYHALYKDNFRRLQTRFDETVERLKLSPQDVSRLAAVLDLAYAGGVRRLDSMFGAVWQTLGEYGLEGDALIAVTADHGETLYREDRRFKWAHAPDLQPEVITVPLMVRWPGVVVPGPVRAVSRSIDVYPTLAGLASVSLPQEAKIEGYDFSSGLRKQEPFPRLRAYSHGTLRQWSFFEPDVIENIWAAERDGDRLFTWRLQDSQWRFDVRPVGGSVDVPTALDPAGPEHRARAAELWGYRQGLIAAFRRGQPGEAASKEESLGRLDAEQKDVLRSLGYIE